MDALRHICCPIILAIVLEIHISIMHLHFDSDDDMQPQAAPPSAAAPAPLSPQVASAVPRCTGVVRVDFNDLSDPCYVFKVVRSHDASCFGASVSNNRIKLYNLQAAQLTHLGDLVGHTDTITDVSFALPEAPHALHSCSRDGTVRGWDVRSGQQVESYSAGKQELSSFAVADNLIAAGGQGSVLFFDRRTGKQAGCFDDTHPDDVSQLKFHVPSRQLISGSVDGLITVHSTANGLNDDEGFAAALNVSTSVEEIGMYGEHGEKLWVRTGTETLHLWEWMKATREDVEGGDAAFAEALTAREHAAQVASTSGAAPYFEAGVDYLTGCHYDPPSQQLMLMAGTIDGALGFFPLMEQQAAAGQIPPGGNFIGPPAVVLQGGHESIVRSVLFLDPGSNVLCISGGEDAKLCLWGAAGCGPSEVPGVSNGSGSSGGPAAKGKLHLRRSTPY